MTKHQFDAIIAAIIQIQQPAPLAPPKPPPMSVAMLLAGGHTLTGILNPLGTPPSAPDIAGLVLMSVSRVDGAELKRAPRYSWVDIDAIQVVTTN